MLLFDLLHIGKRISVRGAKLHPQYHKVKKLQPFLSLKIFHKQQLILELRNTLFRIYIKD